MGVGHPSSHNRGHRLPKFPPPGQQCRQGLAAEAVAPANLLPTVSLRTPSSGRPQGLRTKAVVAPTHLSRLPVPDVDAIDVTAVGTTSLGGRPCSLLVVAVVAPTPLHH